MSEINCCLRKVLSLSFFKPAFLFILFLIYSGIIHAQCTPVISITGNTCVGSVLTATTNVLPSTITWKLNGITVATQNVNSSVSGVTVAGGNGTGSSPNQLNNPTRLFVDASGNLYIPDMTNSRIQKWAPGATSGVTVAGGNGVGWASNQFNRPVCVFVDNKDNVYVADQYNNRIQKWTPGASSGVTVVSGVDGPTGLFVDANSTIYVSEQFGEVVSKFLPGSSQKIIVAGTIYNSGYAPNQLDAPTGIYVDAAGNVYVCDTDNNRVQKWAPGAMAGTTVAGGIYYGSGANQLHNPISVCLDAAGNMYVSDYSNSRVQKFAPGSNTGVTVAGGNGTGNSSSQFNQPHGIALDASCNLYVSDFFNARVQKFSYSAATKFTASQSGDYTATVTSFSGQIISSNTITVLPQKTPQVNIVADTTVLCPGTAVTFTATPTDGGTSPAMQWKKNGKDVGTNVLTYSDNTLQDGDVISCDLTSNATCITRATAISNSVVVHVLKPQAPVNLGADVHICPGATTAFNASNNYTSYLWQGGSTAPAFLASAAGMYWVQVKDVCGLPSSDTVMVFEYPQPQAFLPPDTAICQFESIALQAATSYKNYGWSTNVTTPIIEVKTPGLYWLQVTDDNNCVGRDSVVISQKTCTRKLFVPTAFTPNGDGRNDKLNVSIIGRLQQFRFVIYNRWGQVAFSSTDPARGWDGRINGAMQDANTFVWTCAYQFVGEPVRNEKGVINLIR